ncbi:MAG: Eco57I restriction-modification methylase domain-containing protein [Bulleidia sp.]|nr:Eco57I restriction-modification methylase domain-containing protein [Bulleidia sp.]
MSKKMFDFVIGNPPYQESRETTKDMPVYNMFMDATYEIATSVELITPARFLFNAGATSKTWNLKMLKDNHFKVLKYVADSSCVFPNNEIKGGVAVHYRNINNYYEPIETFTAYSELNQIMNKVKKSKTYSSLNTIMYSPANCKFTDLFISTQKEEIRKLSKGNEKMLATNVFESLKDTTFLTTKPIDGKSYTQVIGRYNNERVFRWIESQYIEGDNISYWKVCLPKTSGTGKFGETLSMPLVLENNVGYTQSFFSIGKCTKEEANNILKYIKTKFARSLLGVLKVTQDCPPAKWKYVPLQDFTSNSDIDWSKSIHEIDLQLYKKYGLDDKETEFIETHVKEME